jgi:hypothetical protein
MQTDLDRTAKVEFWVEGELRMYALRRMYYVPRQGDNCVVMDMGRPVLSVTWCLDEDAKERGVKVKVLLGDEL